MLHNLLSSVPRLGWVRTVRPLTALNLGAVREAHSGRQCFPLDQPSGLNGPAPAHPQQATIKEMFDNPHLKKRTVPLQLRQSGDGSTGSVDDAAMGGKGLRLLVDTRVRKGPRARRVRRRGGGGEKKRRGETRRRTARRYFHLSQEQGAWCYQIYNNIYHPRAYHDPTDGGLWKEYEALTNAVTMWNARGPRPKKKKKHRRERDRKRRSRSSARSASRAPTRRSSSTT